MLYDNKGLNKEILETLNDKYSKLVDNVMMLLDEGYVSSRSETNKLEWGFLLIDAYENINVLERNQQDNIDRIYNQVLKL